MVSAPFDISSLITSAPEVHGGRPCLAGTGITVHTVAAAHNEGLTIDEILTTISADAAHIHAALAYYFANKSAVDADLAADRLLYHRLAGQHPDGVRGVAF